MEGNMEFSYSEYALRKWSLMVRARDGRRCQLCLEPGTLEDRLEAHHIEPKFHCPEKVLELDNGITLHASHHQPMVHTTDDHYIQFRHMFKRYNKRKAVREFNAKYQYKLDNLKDFTEEQ